MPKFKFLLKIVDNYMSFVYMLKVHTQRGKEIHLLRMRDPLGYTIWKGPWNQKWVVLNLKSTDLQNILC